MVTPTEYRMVFSMGLRTALYNIDSFLSGKDGLPFRLSATQYDEARDAIVTLYRIAKQPELEATPTGRALNRARADDAFQSFLTQVNRPKKKK